MERKEGVVLHHSGFDVGEVRGRVVGQAEVVGRQRRGGVVAGVETNDRLALELDPIISLDKFNELIAGVSERRRHHRHNKRDDEDIEAH